jgi:hypothetical protein
MASKDMATSATYTATDMMSKTLQAIYMATDMKDKTLSTFNMATDTKSKTLSAIYLATDINNETRSTLYMATHMKSNILWTISLMATDMKSKTLSAILMATDMKTLVTAASLTVTVRPLMALTSSVNEKRVFVWFIVVTMRVLLYYIYKPQAEKTTIIV